MNFKKYNIASKYNQNHKDVYIITTLDKYAEYLKLTETTQIGNIVESWSNQAKRDNKGHHTNIIAETCDELSNINGKSPFENLNIIMQKKHQGIVNAILRGNQVVFRNNGTWMIIHSSDVITEIVNHKYTIDNIRVKKWGGGSHYYAYVSDMDVQDVNGNVKWNTYDEAMRQATLFLDILNKKD